MNEYVTKLRLVLYYMVSNQVGLIFIFFKCPLWFLVFVATVINMEY